MICTHKKSRTPALAGIRDLCILSSEGLTLADIVKYVHDLFYVAG